MLKTQSLGPNYRPQKSLGILQEDGPLPSPTVAHALEATPVAHSSSWWAPALTPLVCRVYCLCHREKGQGKRGVSLSSGCLLPGLHPRPREPLLAVAVATGSAQSLGQRAGGQDGNSPRFSLLRGPGSWAGPVQGSGFPKCTILGVGRKTFFNPSKCIVPAQLFYYQDHCQGNPENPHSPGVEPLRGWHQGAQELRTVPTSSSQSIPHWPLLSYPLSLVSSSSNTNCLHGKPPSMTRSSTHKRKLWATDPTS